MTIDLRLRTASVHGREDATLTFVPWFNNKNFFKRLKFKAWSNFGNKVHSESTSLASPASDVAHTVLRGLEMVNHNLNEYGAKHESDLLQRGLISFGLEAARELAGRDSLCHGARFENQIGISSERMTTMLTPSRARNRPPTNSNEMIHLRPDFLLFETDKDVKDMKNPLGIVEVKGPLVKLVPDGTDGRSATSIAKWLQKAFDRDPADQKYIVNHVAQTIAQALHTRSGCAMLTNHNNAIFIHVVKKDRRESRVEILVSRVYKCDEQEGTVLATAVWILECFKNACVSNESARKSREVEMVDSVDFIAESSCYDAGSSSAAGSSSQSPPVTRSRAKSKRHGENKERSMVPEETELCLSSFQLQRLEHWNECVLNFLATWAGEESAAAVEKVRNDGLVRKVLSGYREFVWDKGSAVVTKGMFGDTAVAIKYVHQAKGMEAVYHVENEFVTYCKLFANGEGDCCFGVPRLIACGVDYWYGPVIVTQFVGRRVRRCGGGRLLVGDEEVGKEEAGRVREAAVKSLRMLHAQKVKHNDVELRNLQVERVRTGTWKAWWVDLGLATRETRRHIFETEIEHCEEIFAEGYAGG